MTDKTKTTTYNADSRTDPRGNPSPIPQLLRPPRSNYPEPDRPVLPPQDFSFDNQPPRELYRPEPVPPAEPGFYVVPRSMLAGELHRSLFDAMPAEAIRKFSALNPDLEIMVKAGSLIVLSDPNNNFCTYQEAQLMQAAQQVKAALDPRIDSGCNAR